MPLAPAPQTFYQNASNFAIGTQNLTIHNRLSASSIGRNELPQPIPDASHHRNRKSSPPDSNCLPGTREGVITKITSWAKDDNPDHAQIALWLCGSVGSGKSAISQAVSEALERCNRLAASFFFFRGSGERSRFASVPITLASQMALSIPETAVYIMDAVEKMGGWSVSKQMEELIYKPIQLAFTDRGSADLVSIVLDGLDECQDKEEVEEFIDHLLEYFEGNPTMPLRFIIASRIEQHIQGRLETEQVAIEDLADHSPDDDIRTFLLASFSRAAKQSRIIRAYGKWPSDEDVETLLSHIDGSFIFASTIVKYVLGPPNDGLTPMERLPLALEMNLGLDGLYTETLKRCSHFPHFTDILAPIVLARNPLCLSELSGLLHVPTFRILNVLDNLQAIIHIPGDDYAQVTIFHTSLRDYMTAESRSGPFFISPSHHDELAHKWLKLVCCASHLDGRSDDMRTSVDGMSGKSDAMVVDGGWIRHALHHWIRGSSVTSTFAFVAAFIDNCCPYYSPVKGDEISWTIKYGIFYTAIFRMLDAIEKETQDTVIESSRKRPVARSQGAVRIQSCTARLCQTQSDDGAPLEGEASFPVTSLRHAVAPRHFCTQSLMSRNGMTFDSPTRSFSQYANVEVACTVVRTAILFFNYCISCTTPAFLGELGGGFLLRYWVKLLAVAVEGDSSLTLEFLQTRDYQPFDYDSMPDPRICEWYTFLYDTQAMSALKDDVLAAEKAIETRFPGTLPDLPSILGERQRLVTSSYPEQFDPGVSVLDVFNAYRNFVLSDASPLEEASVVIDESSHMEVNFTHERRGHIPKELRLHMYRDSPVTKEDPVYIGFSVAFLDAELYPGLYKSLWEARSASDCADVCRPTIFYP